MPFGIAAAVVGVAGAYMASEAQGDAAHTAAEASQRGTDASIASQERIAQLSIDEQRRQFDFVQNTLSPYVQAGGGAMNAQMELLGLGPGGADAQRAAIERISSDPNFMALQGQAEDALLQNLNATGGVRGGNAQTVLAQLRPGMLQQAIGDRFARLGSIAGMGQASAAGQAQMAMQTGGNIQNALSQQGNAAQAALMANASNQGQAALAAGQAQAGFYSSAADSVSTLAYLRMLQNRQF